MANEVAGKAEALPQDALSDGARTTLTALLDRIALAGAADLARAGHHSDAESLLSETIQARPAPAGALDLLARIHAQQGKLSQAEACWTQALQLDPANGAYLAGLKRIAQLRRKRVRLAFLVPAFAPLIVIALLALSAWLTISRVNELERSVARQLAGVETSVRDAAAGLAALERSSDTSTGVPAAATAPPVTSQPSPPLIALLNDALQADRDLAALDLAVRQRGATVYVRGAVPTPELKGRAEGIAGAVAGAANIDTSGIVVVPSLVAAARDALGKDPRTAGLALEIEQLGGNLRLKGMVPSFEAKNSVETVARGVAGVMLVDSGGVRVEPPAMAYVVKPGDSLASIARQFYGDPDRWPMIYEANRDQVSDPRIIGVGARLLVPTGMR